MYSMILRENHKKSCVCVTAVFEASQNPQSFWTQLLNLFLKQPHWVRTIISHFVHQARQRKETYSWVGFVNSFKTKVNCKTNAAVSKQSQYITTSACSCCNSFCETHSWYSTSWLAVVVFVCVKLCIYRQRMHLEYGQGQGRHITEQFAVEFLTAKQARYSVKQFAAVEFIIATQFRPSTICFTVLAPGTAKHAWYSTSWLQLLFLLV